MSSGVSFRTSFALISRLPIFLKILNTIVGVHASNRAFCVSLYFPNFAGITNLSIGSFPKSFLHFDSVSAWYHTNIVLPSGVRAVVELNM